MAQRHADGVKTWIVTREDLILSKLVWARDANSELQRRDAKILLDASVDQEYLGRWAHELDLTEILEEIAR